MIKEGPGFIRNDAYVAGVSLANDEGQSIYLPIRHEAGGNYDPAQVKRYLRDQLGGPTNKVLANALYDVEALWSIDVELKGKWFDIQTAEPLIDEERPDGYSLDAIAISYLGEGKVEGDLKEAASAYGFNVKGDLWRLHPKFVAEYAETDALLPIEIMQKQLKIIKADELENVFDLEQRLQPVLWEMRKNGARVDLQYFHDTQQYMQATLKTDYEKLYKMVGCDLKYTTEGKVAVVLEAMGYDGIPSNAYGLTVSNEWLEARSDDPLCKLLYDLRTLAKVKKDCVDEILRVNVNGRVHTNWLAMASEDGGTRSGRMASRRINLQQIPARHPIYGPMIRKGFIPEDGKKFVHADFNGQEARITIEVGNRLRIDNNGRVNMTNGRMLTGSEDMMQVYVNQPKTDFHNTVGAMIEKETGQVLKRGPLKNLNFGIMYGMGLPKLGDTLGLSKDEAEELKKVYFKGVPFLKEAIDALMMLTDDRGFVRTASGRRRRFKKFQAKSYEARKRWGYNYTFESEEEAIRELGEDRTRAFLHKVFNAVIQGSAADQTKHALVDLREDHGIIPALAVHDEICVYGNEDEAKALSTCMQDAMARHYNYRIPFVANARLLNNWGEGK